MTNPSSSPLASRRVCIIGAGMTGLCACKHLLRHGLQPTVLESKDRLGGVWCHTFASTKLQTPREAYQFSDFLWPHDTPEYPTHYQVMDYLHSYAEHFHVLERIRFNCKVVEIRSGLQTDPVHGSSLDLWGMDGGPFPKEMEDHGRPAWEVRIQRTSSAKEGDALADAYNEEWLCFDFLVLCIGRYGDIPKLPSFPLSRGPEIFKGKVLHSMDYALLDDKSAENLLSGKRVIVVGILKSALDVAMEAANYNGGSHGYPCTLIFKRAYWMLPHNKPFGVPMSYLFATRFSELLIPKPDQGFLLSVISTILSPVRWAFSKFVELYLRLNLPLREFGLIPQQTFLEQMSSCQIPLLPDFFFSRVREGKIILQKTTDWSFSKKGLIMDDGTEIEADVVILATGYDGEKKMKSLIPKNYAAVLKEPGSVIPLYRGIIHPHIPYLAILGYHENLSNLHSSEMCARWLAHFLSGKFALPDKGKMQNDVQKWLQYMKQSTPFYHRLCIGAVIIWYSDQLCYDIGWNPRRKKNFLQELVLPYSNMDYKDPDEDFGCL